MTIFLISGADDPATVWVPHEVVRAAWRSSAQRYRLASSSARLSEDRMSARARAARTDAIEYIAQDSPRAALGQLDGIEKQTDC